MKIGITTHYYKSNNYGGNLQAYALCRWLKQNGHQAEQICFSIELQPIDTFCIKKSFKDKLHDIIINFKVFVYNILHGKNIYKPKYKKIYSNINSRIETVCKFNMNYIPHSKKVYSKKNIVESLDCYDCFITGSDLVWAPTFTSVILLLAFVNKNIPKFSYAASLGTEFLSQKEKNKFKNYLQSFQSISVREQSGATLLKDISPVPVEVVLDPTLLLKKEDWDEICSHRLINHKYIFCYFLGDNPKSRQLAKSYAAMHNLKLITIPYLSNKYRECDKNFGDEQLFSVSPADFISLIKYADCVFTDSFHACVFSYIYNRNVFAFLRNENDKIGIRVKNFLDLVNISSHYCDTPEKENIYYINNLKSANELYDSSKLEQLKNKSIEFLNKSLKKAEEKIKKQ